MNYWWIILALAAVLVGRSTWGVEAGKTVSADPFYSNAAVVRDAETGRPLQRLRVDPFDSNSYRLENYETGGDAVKVESNPFGDGYRTEPED